LHFAKDCAKHIVEGKQPLVIPPTFLNFLALGNKYYEAHVPHVAEVETPGIVVFGAMMVNGQPSLLAFLITVRIARLQHFERARNSRRTAWARERQRIA
jgi:hypothetical protein